MRHVLFLILCCLTLSGSLSAQTTYEMSEKAGQEYKEADAELNRVYKELIGHLQKGEKDALITAQLAWIKFRDTDAEAVAFQNKGGTIYPVVYASARTRTTRDRTKQLQEWLEVVKQRG